ncbi:MAG: ABC transporter ATP-binding protein [candidate division Zixibacteria bacterium]|nr:ABC transporter ATP-binding protein [candidate division Zixibacteria bacterium]MBU1470270.1 ABC transporter ATP-binding protein [candidate division Zixibacteria bacterium]MBU2626412.1 ABC transporter ATP-binding protein [candidate division Zixibacteria bacterium]
MARLIINNLCKSFDGQQIIEDFSLNVSDGEFLVLLGPSGCGKSTLLRMIAGLESADSGEIIVGGHNITHLPPRNRDIAMVFQNYALYPHMTIYDNIAFPLKMRKVPKDEIDRQVKSTAELLGLSEMLYRKPGTLSGGQRQRVAVGRAIVRNPKLFLFDEPLSNLDAKLRVSMRTEILRLMHRLSATVVYVTHDQEEALTMGDRIAVLYESVVQQVGTPQQIYERPANTYVARFVGSPRMNILNVQATEHGKLTLTDGTFVAALPRMQRARAPKLSLGFRAEMCDLVQDSGIPVTVASTEYVGSDRYLHGKFDSEDVIVRIDPAMTLAADSVVRIQPRTDALVLFDSDGNRIDLLISAP